MRLGDFLPDIVKRDNKLIQSNTMLDSMYNNGFMEFLKSSYNTPRGIQSAVQEYGIEQLYFDWL